MLLETEIGRLQAVPAIGMKAESSIRIEPRTNRSASRLAGSPFSRAMSCILVGRFYSKAFEDVKTSKNILLRCCTLTCENRGGNR